jgi:hypothetical protein
MDHCGKFSGHTLGHGWVPGTMALIFICHDTLECTLSANPVGVFISPGAGTNAVGV